MTESVNLPVNTAVQNGTTRTKVSVENYVERFKDRRRDEAKAIIELGEVLVEAETKLSKANFTTFCDRVEVAKNGSYYKKLRTIGKSAERFHSLVGDLPNNWTTIYKLAQMDDDKFEAFVDADRLSPNLKGREIDEFLQKPPKKRKQKEVYVSFKTPDPDTRRQIIAALKESIAKFDGKAVIVESDPVSIAAPGASN